MSRWEGTHLGMTSSPLISPSASLRHATSWVSKIYRGRDNSIPAESPAFPTGSRSIRTNTFSMTLNRIWLSGSAPSRLSQRSSTMPGSSSTSLRGSVRDPRAWPQLWDSYLQTQSIWSAFLFGWIRCCHRYCWWPSLWESLLLGHEPGSESLHPTVETWNARRPGAVKNSTTVLWSHRVHVCHPTLVLWDTFLRRTSAPIFGSFPLFFNWNHAWGIQ